MYRWAFGLLLIVLLFRTGLTDNTDGEAEVEIGNLPPAAREAVLKAADGAPLQRLARESENGTDVYEAEWAKDGIAKEITVLASGQIVESEEAVSIDSLPKQARDAIQKHLAEAKEIKIAKKLVIQFEAEGTINGRETEIVVAPNGKVISREDDGEEEDEDEDDEDGDGQTEETEVTLDDVPPTVAKTLRRESAGGEIEEIEKSQEDGKTVYEAEVEIDGHDYEVTVREDGVLLEKELED